MLGNRQHRLLEKVHWPLINKKTQNVFPTVIKVTLKVIFADAYLIQQ